MDWLGREERLDTVLDSFDDLIDEVRSRHADRIAASTTGFRVRARTVALRGGTRLLS